MVSVEYIDAPWFFFGEDLLRTLFEGMFSCFIMAPMLRTQS